MPSLTDAFARVRRISRERSTYVSSEQAALVTTHGRGTRCGTSDVFRGGRSGGRWSGYGCGNTNGGKEVAGVRVLTILDQIKLVVFIVVSLTIFNDIFDIYKVDLLKGNPDMLILLLGRIMEYN